MGTGNARVQTPSDLCFWFGWIDTGPVWPGPDPAWFEYEYGLVWVTRMPVGSFKEPCGLPVGSLCPPCGCLEGDGGVFLKKAARHEPRAQFFACVPNMHRELDFSFLI